MQTINLSYCNGITNEGLKYLKEVQTIDLSYCNGITNKGLKYLQEVQTINLSNKITLVGSLLPTNRTKEKEE